jgi:hypothetical protein
VRTISPRDCRAGRQRRGKHRPGSADASRQPLHHRHARSWISTDAAHESSPTDDGELRLLVRTDPMAMSAPCPFRTRSNWGNHAKSPSQQRATTTGHSYFRSLISLVLLGVGCRTARRFPLQTNSAIPGLMSAAGCSIKLATSRNFVARTPSYCAARKNFAMYQLTKRTCTVRLPSTLKFCKSLPTAIRHGTSTSRLVARKNRFASPAGRSPGNYPTPAIPCKQLSFPDRRSG